MRNSGNIYLLSTSHCATPLIIKADFRFWKCALFLLFGLHFFAIVCARARECVRTFVLGKIKRMHKKECEAIFCSGECSKLRLSMLRGKQKSLHSITERSNILNENGEGRGYAVCRRPVFGVCVCVPAWPGCIFIAKLWSNVHSQPNCGYTCVYVLARSVCVL